MKSVYITTTKGLHLPGNLLQILREKRGIVSCKSLPFR
jgi:hypothetical protein